MDRSAIEALQEIITTSFVDLPGHGIPAAVIPKGMQVAQFEHLMDHPVRQRAKVKTQRIADFTKYVNHEAGDGTAVFIASDARNACGVIDFGQPGQSGWKEHRIILDLPLSPEFNSLHEFVLRGGVTQRELIEFIEDWHHIIGAEGVGGEDLTAKKAIASIRSVTIESVRNATNEEADFEASVSALEKVSAKGGKGALPAVLRFSAPYLQELEVQQFEVRLSLLTAGDKPMFKPRIVGLDRIQTECAKQVEERILGGLSSVNQIYVGELHNGAW